MATSESFRKVHLNNDEENERLRREGRYSDNYVTTSKYTLVSFVPKMLFEFFRVIANCYFLVISILQVATTWSPTNKYTTAGPLVIVLMVSMIKQGIEDKKRHDADSVQNSRLCKVLGRNGEIVTKEWQEVVVGDILRLGDRDEAPADVFILSTSEEEGRCFVETCNLDGETNLKRRSAIEQVAHHVGYRRVNDPALPESDHSKQMMKLSAIMDYEQPNNRLYNFTGRVEFGPNKEAAPIGPSNIILRGCSVRGCAYIYGLVIFTGSETKLMQNARSTPSKQSNVYKVVNRCIVLIFITQFVLCIISTICNTIWMNKYREKLWYFSTVFTQTSSGSNLVSFFTFLILYNNLVPISLYVSLDMVKVMQAKNISTDSEMCHEGTYANARTSDLNEELGQIHHIFSDKTGTLTCNIMEFRKCFIAGVSYGYGTTEIGRAVAEMARKNASANGLSGGIEDKVDDEKQHDPRDAQVEFNPSIHFDDPRLINALATNAPEAKAIDEFLTVLSVCHTVIPEKNAKTGEIDYRASSPDEEALVKAAKCLGYNFFAPAPLLEVSVTKKNGSPVVRKYSILNVNEFNSTRKRMSVTLRTEDGRYFLYCKGADNVMMPRSKMDKYSTKMDEELKRFASEGLRTLVICSKQLTEEEYLAWDVKYQEAVTSLTNRDELLEQVAEIIETEMKIVGATAIEDKLQAGVPAAIANLAQAGIKIWMLTGDKEETAINIGHACQLINEGMSLLIINSEDLDDLGRQVDKIYKLEDVQSHINSNKVSSHLALVCDGKAMVHVFPPKNTSDERALHAAKVLSQMLLDISSVCQAVIACRVSPAQKADIVNLIRYNSPQKPITLAIGDGANDVNMIQSAHVGIGVSGQEGVQAVNASDYAIAQFRFLERLLLVHGRYNYQRISKVILYSFYKNVALVIALFLFNFYNGQSGTSVFESFVMAGWNFFLAMPIIAIGVFDEDVAPDQVLRNPTLYMPGQKNDGINMKRFSTWLVNAIIQAFICFMLAMYGTINVGGLSAGLYLQGSVTYSVLLMSANLKVVLETLSWTKFNRMVLAFSFWLFFFFLLVFPFMGALGRDLYGVSLRLLSSPVYWLYLLLVPLTANLLDISLKSRAPTDKPSISRNSGYSHASVLPLLLDVDQGYMLSSEEDGGDTKDDQDSRELASLKVFDFHCEAVASFTKERPASFSTAGPIVPGASTRSGHLSAHLSGN
ncbi:Phospholipid-transporting ATPase IB [Phytophthora citrophthora]|uniref:Phospholipid-transporting ATPase n=1 Tax=Phytophthora citrophthora TaxID=4793 RepID=A0AAD9G5C0_9STRA|nr:Phospholipid-transporting ATPase IB [Phytophthora citrophthora]